MFITCLILHTSLLGQQLQHASCPRIKTHTTQRHVHYSAREGEFATRKMHCKRAGGYAGSISTGPAAKGRTSMKS